jgi:hypothetical protein
MTLICHILNFIYLFFFKSPDFYGKFKSVAKNTEGIWFFATLISSM